MGDGKNLKKYLDEKDVCGKILPGCRQRTYGEVGEELADCLG